MNDFYESQRVPKIGQFLQMVTRFCDLQYLQLNNEKKNAKAIGRQGYTLGPRPFLMK